MSRRAKWKIAQAIGELAFSIVMLVTAGIAGIVHQEYDKGAFYLLLAYGAAFLAERDADEARHLL